MAPTCQQLFSRAHAGRHSGFVIGSATIVIFLVISLSSGGRRLDRANPPLRPVCFANQGSVLKWAVSFQRLNVRGLYNRGARALQ